MCFNHTNNYDRDCLDCIKENNYAPALSRYDFNNFDTSKYVNKIVSSSKPVAVYNEPGGAPRKTVQPGGYIGRTEAFNSKMNWMKLANGLGWIYFDQSLTYTEPDKKDLLSDKDKIALVAEVVSKTNPATVGVPPPSVTKAVGNTALGITEAADSVLDIASFLTGNLKWVLLVVFVLVVGAILYRIAH